MGTAETPTPGRFVHSAGDWIRRRAGLVVLFGVLCVVVLLAGCADRAAQADSVAVLQPTVAEETVTAPAVVRTAPTDGATGVRPDDPATVSVHDGRLSKVTLARPDGTHIPGEIARDGRSWTSTGPLPVAETLTLTARARNLDASERVSVSSVFTTLSPRDTEKVAISPRTGARVGVAMPIIATFDYPVRDKATVESRLRVESTPTVEGSWHWDSDRSVTYRPRAYWPGGASVKVHADLTGVEITDGIWGAAREPVSFSIGAATVSVVDLTNHTMTVTRDGQVLRTIPITAGKDGMETRVGTKVIMTREASRRMDAATVGIPKDDPDYYNLDVQYAMRLTYSGEFLHAAPWSASSHGKANVSHGCTGMGDADARWLMGESNVGDPVEFIHGTRPLDSGNGWTMWNTPYEQWRVGSALT